MTINYGKNETSLVVAVDGDIDHHSAAEIREKIDKAFLRANARHIIIDFTNVGFIDSSGVGMMIGRYKMLKNRGESGKLIAVCGSDSGIKRLFDVTGLTKITICAENVEKALKMVGGGA